MNERATNSLALAVETLNQQSSFTSIHKRTTIRLMIEPNNPNTVRTQATSLKKLKTTLLVRAMNAKD